ncbi:MAG: hypothetical protein CTY22_05200 [Methylomonas sp.]|nr:MAG: hypothetical protein CTY23_00655 [Methylomonas sp.]PPD26417.1 MAG: hypothetical protein CTY22_05200 [Methylomonas sp.]PPD38166.1 MAG: hypothetical protein CTY21_05195 [Methylomonas sp.]PPD41846.1 MAG: hypothetical protein CTY17_02930 [Methylomonas sp.]PPD51606.1 MAG: hypothetical protein CTY11_11865 [Methylomonas sp.]
MTISLDDQALQSLITALPGQIARARRSAIGTTVTYARQRLQAQMIARTGLPARVFRRVRIKTRRRPESGTVWLGYNPVKAAYVGRVKQDPQGAFAGDYFFPDSFVVRMQSGHVGIFKRGGQSRLGLVEQTVDLSAGPAVARSVAADAGRELRARLADRLRQLNPALS